MEQIKITKENYLYFCKRIYFVFLLTSHEKYFTLPVPYSISTKEVIRFFQRVGCSVFLIRKNEVVLRVKTRIPIQKMSCYSYQSFLEEVYVPFIAEGINPTINIPTLFPELQKARESFIQLKQQQNETRNSTKNHKHLPN